MVTGSGSYTKPVRSRHAVNPTASFLKLVLPILYSLSSTGSPNTELDKTSLSLIIRVVVKKHSALLGGKLFCLHM